MFFAKNGDPTIQSKKNKIRVFSFLRSLFSQQPALTASAPAWHFFCTVENGG